MIKKDGRCIREERKRRMGASRLTQSQFPLWASVIVVQLLSHVQLFVTPWTAAGQASLSFISPEVCSNSCPLNWWYHPTISIIPFSFNLSQRQGLFQWVSSSLEWGSQSIGVSASTSVLPMNIQDWFHFGWTGSISLLSKGLSRVFSNTTVQQHQFFGAQPSSQSYSHIHTWPQEKP